VRGQILEGVGCPPFVGATRRVAPTSLWGEGWGERYITGGRASWRAVSPRRRTSFVWVRGDTGVAPYRSDVVHRRGDPTGRPYIGLYADGLSRSPIAKGGAGGGIIPLIAPSSVPSPPKGGEGFVFFGSAGSPRPPAMLPPHPYPLPQREARVFCFFGSAGSPRPPGMLLPHPYPLPHRGRGLRTWGTEGRGLIQPKMRRR
jgi:hypothetical protein